MPTSPGADAPSGAPAPRTDAAGGREVVVVTVVACVAYTALGIAFPFLLNWIVGPAFPVVAVWVVPPLLRRLGREST